MWDRMRGENVSVVGAQLLLPLFPAGIVGAPESAHSEDPRDATTLNPHE